jgi:hypothetical protein
MNMRLPALTAQARFLRLDCKGVSVLEKWGGVWFFQVVGRRKAGRLVIPLRDLLGEGDLKGSLVMPIEDTRHTTAFSRQKGRSKLEGSE